MVAQQTENPLPTLEPVKPARRAEGIKTVARPPDRREKRFAELIAQGFPMWKAYQAVSGAKNKDTCEKQGQRWCARAAVSAEITRQRHALTEETAMTRAEKRNVLGQVARDPETPPNVRVSAVAVDNRMTGDDDPFRKAAGEDLRVTFFVVRLGEDGAPALPIANAAPGLPADPLSSAIDVTPEPSP